MIDLKVNFENLSEEEKQQLLFLVEKSNKPKVSKVFRPNNGDDYWILSVNGDIHHMEWTDVSIDFFRRSLGNVYRTKEEAELALKRQKAKTKYINFLRDNEPEGWVCDWEGEQVKAYLFYEHESKSFDGGLSYKGQNTEIELYSTEETIKLAIDTPEILDAWKCYMGIASK